MEAASIYFKKGLYENCLDTSVESNGGQLKIGLRSSTMDSYYWVIFDNFRLHFFGTTDPNTPSGIDAMSVNSEKRTMNIYDLQGRKLNSLPATGGIYVVDGKKMVVK